MNRAFKKPENDLTFGSRLITILEFFAYRTVNLTIVTEKALNY